MCDFALVQNVALWVVCSLTNLASTNLLSSGFVLRLAQEFLKTSVMCFGATEKINS